MFEAKILQGLVLKKIIEAIRELVQEANLECTDRSITMQVHLIEFTSDHSLICLFFLRQWTPRTCLFVLLS